MSPELPERVDVMAVGAHPDEEQDISGITLLISSDKISEAKRRIKEFRRSLAQYLEAPAGSPKPELYRIGVQLFPLKKP